MGTSSNQPSPNTPNWQPAQAILGDPNWPVERQSEELWRSALTDRDGRLTEELVDPLLASACEIAEERIPPASAVQSFNDTLCEQYAAGLTLDMAKRALARASASGSGSVGFAEEFFAEATSYYASRDLPSFVGAAGRIQTSTDSIDLKENCVTLLEKQQELLVRQPLIQQDGRIIFLGYCLPSRREGEQ